MHQLDIKLVNGLGIISVNFFTFGIVSVGFHEIDFFTFGIISVNFFTLRNHLGGISRD
jgi:hypothetical protein